MNTEPGTKPLQEQLICDQVLWELKDQQAVSLLRLEAETFCAAMEAGKGRSTDTPRMYWSGLEDNGARARDARDFPDASVLVVSVGGSHAHFRALKISRGEVQELVNPRGNRNIVTPCGDEQVHSLEEMLMPIAKEAYAWLKILDLRTRPHIMLNWGFPQRSVILSSTDGLTGAIGEIMTKGQRGVQAEGREIQTVFRTCLQQICSENRTTIDISAVRITVQNDTVMAMFRYLERSKRAQYRTLALMILGTGVNITSLAGYATGETGDVIIDEEGLPVRVNSSDPACSSRPYWLDYEVGRLKPVSTQSHCDRLAPAEVGETAENIENFGLAGTGFGRIFHNLVHDHIAEAETVWSLLSSLLALNKYQPFPEAEWVVKLSGRHLSAAADATVLTLTSAGIGNSTISQLQVLASAVIDRSAVRAATVLAAVSLFSGFGLQTTALPDALAMEGSIWKIKDFQGQVLKSWSAILQPELRDLALHDLHVSLIVEDNYNAGVLGPAYLLGQYL